MKATNIYQTLKSKGYGTDGTKPQLPGVGSPLKKSPYKFNAGLKKAAAEGKLDNNPKFKDAVESSPAKLAPVVAAVGKKLLVGAAKKMIAKKAAEKLQQKQGSPAMMKDDPKKKKAIKSKKVGPEGVSYGKVTKTRNYDKPTGMKASPAKKYKSDAQRKAVHASKAEKASPAAMKEDGKKAKLISEKKDPKTGITTRKYDVGTNMPKIVKTKASPAKKSCGSPVKMDLGVAGPGNPKKAIRKAKRKATKGHKVGVRASNICKRSTRGKGSTYRN